MSVRNFLAHVVGVIFVSAGFAWVGLDAVSNDGRIAMTTGIGALALVLAGGFLFDKKLVGELLKWLFSQAREVKSIVAGRVDNA